MAIIASDKSNECRDDNEYRVKSEMIDHETDDIIKYLLH